MPCTWSWVPRGEMCVLWNDGRRWIYVDAIWKWRWARIIISTERRRRREGRREKNARNYLVVHGGAAAAFTHQNQISTRAEASGTQQRNRKQNSIGNMQMKACNARGRLFVIYGSAILPCMCLCVHGKWSRCPFNSPELLLSISITSIQLPSAFDKLKKRITGGASGPGPLPKWKEKKCVCVCAHGRCGRIKNAFSFFFEFYFPWADVGRTLEWVIGHILSINRTHKRIFFFPIYQLIFSSSFFFFFNSPTSMRVSVIIIIIIIPESVQCSLLSECVVRRVAIDTPIQSAFCWREDMSGEGERERASEKMLFLLWAVCCWCWSCGKKKINICMTSIDNDDECLALIYFGGARTSIPIVVGIFIIFYFYFPSASINFHI